MSFVDVNFFFCRCITRDQCPIMPEGVDNLAVQNVTETSVIVTFDHTLTAESYDIILTSNEDSAPGKTSYLNATETMTKVFYEFVDLLPGKILDEIIFGLINDTAFRCTLACPVQF